MVRAVCSLHVCVRPACQPSHPSTRIRTRTLSLSLCLLCPSPPPHPHHSSAIHIPDTTTQPKRTCTIGPNQQELTRKLVWLAGLSPRPKTQINCSEFLARRGGALRTDKEGTPSVCVVHLNLSTLSKTPWCFQLMSEASKQASRFVSLVEPLCFCCPTLHIYSSSFSVSLSAHHS